MAHEGYIRIFCARICFFFIFIENTNQSLSLDFCIRNMRKSPNQNETNREV
jgi:hypothetical protein